MNQRLTIFFTCNLLIFSGCVEFPQEDARAKAKLLREKGYGSEANRLERDSEYEPKKRIIIGKPGFDPADDPYHFPELHVPPEKRGYKIKISSAPQKDP